MEVVPHKPDLNLFPLSTAFTTNKQRGLKGTGGKWVRPLQQTKAFTNVDNKNK
jgi:hypothetical protein